ncbi:hypothetical protein HGI30_03395 [Paenibacillus albicereus]|uniref:Uncharacterized protein n=1 Tax=Paenibacillus albicereus TaxID=2726185 RepID=A0A6H2GTF9_9BACL|nr:hypothetical protein [Paenibacillus albicereus]QJC50713.1 hypothetical protein HGI30_03395 [Paenibacillus albicereus]
MNKLPGIVLAIIMMTLLLVLPAQAQALSCTELRSGEEAYAAYDGIAVGRVERVSEGRERNLVRIAVETSYKGVVSERIVAEEDKSWGALNGPSQVGEEYLFFLRTKGEHWENPLCAPSRPIHASAKELAFLMGKEIPLEREPADAGEGWRHTLQRAAEGVFAAAAIGWIAAGIVIAVRQRRV